MSRIHLLSRLLDSRPSEIPEFLCRQRSCPLDSVDRNGLQHAHDELDALADRLRAKGHTVDTWLVSGPTVQTILEQAEKLDADVIVMGSHGRGKLFDLVVGSVSAGVIRESRVPVLVVPAGKA